MGRQPRHHGSSRKPLAAAGDATPAARDAAHSAPSPGDALPLTQILSGGRRVVSISYRATTSHAHLAPWSRFDLGPLQSGRSSSRTACSTAAVSNWSKATVV